jgi:hypothetical protein
MDIRPPKAASESFTIIRAQGLMMFSRIVGTVALCSQLGIFTLVPEKYQKPVSTAVLLIGVGAVAAGNEKQGSAIIQDRMAKRDVYTESGKPGADKENALHQVFMNPAELALAQKAVAGQLVAPDTKQVQAAFEEKILSKIDQFKPVVFPANPPQTDMHEQVAALAKAQSSRSLKPEEVI